MAQRAAGDAIELEDGNKEIATGGRVEIWRNIHTNVFSLSLSFLLTNISSNLNFL